jgi:hypothetical protein
LARRREAPADDAPNDDVHPDEARIRVQRP